MLDQVSEILTNLRGKRRLIVSLTVVLCASVLEGIRLFQSQEIGGLSTGYVTIIGAVVTIYQTTDAYVKAKRSNEQEQQ